MDAERLQAALWQHLGLPAPSGGPAALRFDDRLDLQLDAAPDGRELLLCCCLADAGAVSDEQAVRLLQANDMAAGTDGAVLSLDVADQAWMTQRLRLDGLSLDAALAHVTRFVHLARLWQDELAAPAAVAPQASPAGFVPVIYG